MDWSAAPLRDAHPWKTPSDAEDLTGRQLRAGKRPWPPERNVQIHAKPGRVQEGGRRRRLSRTRPAPETAGGAGGTDPPSGRLFRTEGWHRRLLESAAAHP